MGCEFALAELRAADDGMPLEEPETQIDAIIIEPIEPEEIVDQVAGVDSNGHVLLKRHSHSRYPGKVKVYYECEKNEEDPFEALAKLSTNHQQNTHQQNTFLWKRKLVWKNYQLKK